MTFKPLIASVLCVLMGLSGCGSSSEIPKEPSLISNFWNATKGRLTPGQAPAAPIDPRRALTRELLNGSPTPLMLASIEQNGTYFTVFEAERARNVAAWRLADLNGFSLRSGALISTQGFGFDLMSADVTPLLAALRGTGPRRAYTRVHRYLDGENHTQISGFVCDLDVVGSEVLDIFERRYTVQRLTETCFGPETTFENQYWIEGNGTIRQARQWIGPELGMLFTQLLVD